MNWGIDFTGFLLVPFIVLLLIIVLGVALTRRTLADGTAALTPRRLVEGYLFTVLLVAMLLVSSGLADLVRSAIARTAGLESSYRPTPVYEEGQKPEEMKYEYDKNAPRRDLLSGVAQVGVGFLIGGLHLFGLRRLGRTEPVVASPVYRLFLIVGLVIYTTATLAYAVSSVQDSLLYRYVGSPPPRQWYSHPVPGDQVAGLIGFLPVWAFLVVRLFRYAQPRQNRS